MTGGEALVETLLASGINVCFANPGTSEMSFVAALDAHPEMRCVLCLFEGNVTGAADGYARMTGRPAVTLLHLGPGFANSWANLHNARKGQTPMLNVVGDHADYHLKYDAPLQADLEGVVRSVSHWTRRIGAAQDMVLDTAAGIRAAQAHGGQVATLILPADTAWGDTGGVPIEPAGPPPAPHRPDEERIVAAAEALKGDNAALLISGPALYGDLAEVAGQIGVRAGCQVIAPFFAPRLLRGEGTVEMEQLRYPIDDNMAFLAGVERIICVGETPPVTFFAYPGRPSTPEPPGCVVERLCHADWDVPWTIHTLADALGVNGSEEVPRVALHLPDPPEPGPLSADGLGRVLALWLPENAIVVNEALTAGPAVWPHMDRARAHDRINNTGGSIGQCLPNALGAAIACPDRPVLAISGDGSAMYQLQSLWTAARERLDMTVVIIANRGYRILHYELAALGFNAPGRNARRMFDIEDPELDWVALAAGHGVPGARATAPAELEAALHQASETPGPFLIEAVI